jgi:RNA polymerase sigma-70 factor, ECF subfamily
VDASRRDRFEEIAPRLVEPLRRYLARRTDPDTAEDVLAETLLVCWRRVLELPEEPLPWAYAAAALCLRNAERSQRRQRRAAAKVATLDPPQAVVPEAVDHPEVHEALGRMRSEDAEVLRLWAWEQLEPREIAVVLGSTANAVSSRLTRARAKLGEELRKSGAGAGHEGA